MTNKKVISHERNASPTPDSIIVDGVAQYGTFDESFENLNMLDCIDPCGKLYPHVLNKLRLTEWEAVEVNLDEGILVSAIYNAGIFGFSIFVWHDKRTKQTMCWRNIVSAKRAKIAKQLINDHCHIRTGKSEYTISNDMANGKAHAYGYSTNTKYGTITLDIAMERLAPPSCVSMPLGDNKPLYSEKDFLSATGFIEINGEKMCTNRCSVAIIDDHKGYYNYKTHYYWLTTMGKCNIDGQHSYFAINLTQNKCTDPYNYNENLIWHDGKALPLPPVQFEVPHRDSMVWKVRDEHGRVDITFTIDDRYIMPPVKLGIVSMYYALPFGTISGTLVDDNGKVYNIDNMIGIGEDKATKM